MVGFGFHGQVFGGPPVDGSYRLEPGATVAMMGDSIVQLGIVASATAINLTARAGLSWARALDPRFRHLNRWIEAAADPRNFLGHNHGRTGETTSEMEARFAALMAMDPDIVLIAGGTNDVSAGTDAATIIAKLDAMAQAALSANKRVALLTIRPRAVAGAGSLPVGDPKWGVLHAVNQWILAQDRPRLTALDMTPALTDGATDVSGTGAGWFYRARPEYLADNVHLSHLGGYREGTVLAAYLASQVEAGSIWPSDPLAAGNGLPMPALLGTTGSFNAGFGSGQVATGWQIRRYSGDGGEVVCGKEAIDPSLEKQVMTFSAGSSTTPYENHALRPSPDLISIASMGLATGAWVEFGVFVEVSAWDRWQHVEARLNLVDTGGSVAFASRMFPFLSANGQPMPFPDEAWSGWIVTPAVEIPAGVDRLAPALEIQAALAGSSGTGSVKASRPWLRLAAAPSFG